MARILIAEDERQTVDELRDHLELYGLETEVALSAPLAISIIEERKMDLAIIGTRIHDTDGLEVLRRFRELDPGLSTIILTDIKSKRYRASLIKAGARAVLKKPVDKDNVLRLIHNILERPKRPPIKKKRPATKKKRLITKGKKRSVRASSRR